MEKMKKLLSIILSVFLVLLVFAPTWQVNAEETADSIAEFNVADATIFEAASGDTLNYYDYTENEYKQYFHYDIPGSTYTITLEDGEEFTRSSSLFTSSRSSWESQYLYTNNNSYRIRFSDTQEQEHWQVGGTYVVTANLYFGYSSNEIIASTQFYVTVIESPISSIEILDVSYVEGTHRSTSYINSEEYYRYDYSGDFTVIFKDGTRQSASGSIKIGDLYYRLYTESVVPQHIEPWTIGGTYEMVAKLLGVQTTFHISIVKSEIESIEPQDITVPAYENGYYRDGKYVYSLSSKMVIKVNYKDGHSVIVNGNKIQGDNMSYYPSFSYAQSTEEWLPENTYEAYCTFRGESMSFHVTIEKSHVTGIEIIKQEKLKKSDLITSWDGTKSYPIPKFTFCLIYDDGHKTYDHSDSNDYVYTSCDQETYRWSVGGRNEFTVSGFGITITCNAEIEPSGNFEYLEHENGLIITNCYLQDETLEIPDQIDGKTVVGINSFGNASGTIRSVTLPEHIQFLNPGAFTGYRMRLLESIFVSEDNPYYADIDGVLVNKAGNTIIAYPLGMGTEYTIPPSITNIDIFNEITYSSVTISFADNSTAFNTVDGVTYNADMTKVIVCDHKKSGNYIMPDSVTEIAENAFNECSKLKSVAISKNVTSITYRAFASCSSLKTVNLPDHLISISQSAFSGCSSLETVDLPATLKEIGDGSFSYSGLTRLDVPGSVEIIGAMAFYHNSIETLSLSEGLVSIGNSAFAYNNIAELRLPDSVEQVGNGAFSSNEKLESLVLPNNGITRIVYGAFSFCNNLRDIEPPQSLFRISVKAFYNSEWYNSQEDGPIYLGTAFYEYKGNIEQSIFEVRNGTTVISDYAFARARKSGDADSDNSDSLSNVILPDSLKSIGDLAFFNCKQLKSISIPASVEHIGQYAFAGCSSLNAIHVDPNNPFFTDLDGVLFNKDMTELIYCPLRAEEVYRVPRSVLSIAEYAFGESGVSEVKITNPDCFLNAYSVSYKLISVNFDSDNNNYKTVSDFIGTTIRCYENSPAEKYSNQYLLKNESISELNWESKAITVETESDVMPRDAKLTVENKKIKELSLVSNTDHLNLDTAVLYDIYFEKNGEEIQPNGFVQITLPVPENMNPRICSIYYIDEHGNMEDMNAVYSDGNFIFETNHFSYYAIIELGGTAIADIDLNFLETVYADSDLYELSSTLSVTYENEETPSVLTNGYSIVPRVLNKYGRQTVTVKYAGFTKQFTVNAVRTMPENVEILNIPGTTYPVGSEPDFSGILMHFVYNSGRDITVKPDRIEYDFSQPGETTVDLLYIENGISYRDSFDVTVTSNIVLQSNITEVHTGETVTVPITAANLLGIMGYGFDISYDPQVLTPISATPGEAYQDGYFVDSIENASNGHFHVYWCGSDNVIDGGEVFSLTFLVSELADAETSITVTAAEDEVYDANWNTVAVEELDITLTVNDNLLVLTPLENIGLTIKNGLLYGLKAVLNKVEDILEKFRNHNLIAVDALGNELGENDIIGTGSKINIVKNNVILDSVTLVVLGDMNGDGKANNRDVSMLMRYLVEKEQPEECQRQAADVDGDGVINNRDAAKLSRCLVGKEIL